MADADDKLKHVVEDIVEDIEHPIETAKALEKEAEIGESARTPLIAITGVMIVCGIIVALLLAVSLTLYFVYGGK